MYSERTSFGATSERHGCSPSTCYGDSTTEKRLGYKAEQSLASSVDDLRPWMEHKSVDPTFDHNVEIFVANNILQVSFFTYELHCVFNSYPANVENMVSS